MHTVTLENTHGREVATARAVPSNELAQCFKRFAKEAERFACPIIFVDGRGYTSTREFMEMVHTVNEHSTRAGGSQVF